MLRRKLDHALTALLTFALPGVVKRGALWLAHLPERAPKAKSLELVELAREYLLSRSQIRTATLRTASAVARRVRKQRIIRQPDLDLAAAQAARRNDRTGAKPVGF